MEPNRQHITGQLAGYLDALLILAWNDQNYNTITNTVTNPSIQSCHTDFHPSLRNVMSTVNRDSDDKDNGTSSG